MSPATFITSQLIDCWINDFPFPSCTIDISHIHCMFLQDFRAIINSMPPLLLITISIWGRVPYNNTPDCISSGRQSDKASPGKPTAMYIRFDADYTDLLEDHSVCLVGYQVSKCLRYTIHVPRDYSRYTSVHMCILGTVILARTSLVLTETRLDLLELQNHQSCLLHRNRYFIIKGAVYVYSVSKVCEFSSHIQFLAIYKY